MLRSLFLVRIHTVNTMPGCDRALHSVILLTFCDRLGFDEGSIHGLRCLEVDHEAAGRTAAPAGSADNLIADAVNCLLLRRPHQPRISSPEVQISACSGLLRMSIISR